MKLPSKTQDDEQAPDNDFGTPEARRRAFHVITEQPDPQDRSTRRTRLENDMVRWYERRRYISTVQADALRRWHSDAHASGLLPSCIGSYAQSIVGGQSELSDIRIAAQHRRNNAIRFLSALPVVGHFASLLVDALAVDDKFVGKWFMEKGYGTPHDAMIALDRVTTALAKHYGLTK